MAKVEAATKEKATRTRLDVAGQIERMKQEQKDLLAKTDEKLAGLIVKRDEFNGKITLVTAQRDQLKKIVGEDAPKVDPSTPSAPETK